MEEKQDIVSLSLKKLFFFKNIILKVKLRFYYLYYRVKFSKEKAQVVHLLCGCLA